MRCRDARVARPSSFLRNVMAQAGVSAGVSAPPPAVEAIVFARTPGVVDRRRNL